MRRSTLLISTSILAVTFGLVANAAAPTDMSDFYVSTVSPKNTGSKPYCAMANQFSNGIIVTHSRNNFGLGSIGVDFPQVEFEVGKNYEVTLQAGTITRTYAAKAAKKSLLVSKTGRDDALFNALDKGAALSVELGSEGIVYHLDTNVAAFSELKTCVSNLDQVVPSQIIATAPTMPVVPTPAIEENTLADVPVPTMPEPDVQDAMAEPMPAPTTPTPVETAAVMTGNNASVTPVQPMENYMREAVLPTGSLVQLPEPKTGVSKPVTQKVTQEIFQPIAPAPTPAVKKASTAPDLTTPSDFTKKIDDISAPQPLVETPRSNYIAPAPVVPQAQPEEKVVLTPPKPRVEEKPQVVAMLEPIHSIDELSSSTKQEKNIPAFVARQELIVPPVMEKGEEPTAVEAQKFEKQPIIPLSQPISPAQIGLEKSVRRHSIASSDLLFDSPAAARLAVPSTINNTDAPFDSNTAEDRDTETDFVIDTTPPAVEEEIAEIPAPVIDTPVAMPEPVVLPEPEPVIAETAPAPVIAAPEKVVEAPVSRGYSSEAVLPTDRLVTVPEHKNTASSPVTNSYAPVATYTPPAPKVEEPVAMAVPDKPIKQEKIETVAAAPITTPEPVFAKPTEFITAPKLVAPEPTSAPIVEVHPAPQPRFVSSPKKFLPPAAESVQDWTIKSVEQTNDFPAYCLVSNRFENGMGIYATRGPDGNSTLGLDFGFGILEQGRQYAVTVEVDHLFNDDFTAQANDDALMVVPMGQQDAFFSALHRGQALHIEMPGAASTFDLAKMSTAYAQFTQCIAAQNGTMIAETTAPVVTMAAPVTTTVATVSDIAKTPVLAKNTIEPVVTQKTTMPLFDNVVATPAPTTSSAVQPVDLSSFSRQFVPNNNSFSNDSLSIDSILTASRIGYSSISIDDQDSNIIHWATNNDNVSGVLVETPWVSQTSLLDQLMDDVDMMEQTCMGEFTSQIGIPENYGNNVIANAETKCTINGQSVSAAHIYQGSGDTIKVWTQSGPSAYGQDILGGRNKIASILRQRATTSKIY